MKNRATSRGIAPAVRAKYVSEAIRLLQAKGDLRLRIIEAALVDAVREGQREVVRDLATVAALTAPFKKHRRVRYAKLA